MNIKFSVLMPAYNASRFIQESIDSVLNQTFSDFELIIINDGSVDDTEKIILSYSDSRIKYVKNDRNLGLIKTLNEGLNYAHGEYIARIDADDIALPQWLDVQYKILIKQQVDFVQGRVLNMSEDGSKIFNNMYSNVDYDSNEISLILPFENCIGHPGVVVKTSIIKKIKYLDDESVTHFEDLDLWNRMSDQNVLFYKHSIPIVCWRLNTQSITHTKYDDKLLKRKNEYKINCIKKKYIKEIGVLSEYICENRTTFSNIKKISFFFKEYYSSTRRLKIWSYIYNMRMIRKKNEIEIKKLIKILYFLSLNVEAVPLIIHFFCKQKNSINKKIFHYEEYKNSNVWRI